MPFLTSITAILFYLRIAKILTPVLGNNKLIKYVSKNTYTIMENHQFVFFIFNYLSYKFLPDSLLTNFNIEEFKNDSYYPWYPGNHYNFLIFKSILGIFLPLLLKSLIEKLYIKFKKYRLS